MAMISVSDNVLLALSKELKVRMLPEPSQFVETLIMQHLRQVGALGFDRDEMTGALTGHVFRQRVRDAFRMGRADRQLVGCHIVKGLGGGRPDHEKKIVDAFGDLQLLHGDDAVFRWDDVSFLVWRDRYYVQSERAVPATTTCSLVSFDPQARRIPEAAILPWIQLGVEMGIAANGRGDSSIQIGHPDFLKP